LIGPWCCDPSISVRLRRRNPLSRISAGVAAASGPEHGRTMPAPKKPLFRRQISQSAIVLCVPTPQVFRHWQATACPRAARKSATYRSPRSPYWQPWCRRSAQMTLQIGFGSRAGAMNAYVSPNGEAIQVRAPQWPFLITLVKTNPTCAVSNTAGTRLRKTAPFLPDLFRVSRSASGK
jgi:hypothetical protein